MKCPVWCWRILLPSLLTACLCAAGVVSLPASVFWSPDEGGKFLQMAGLEPGIPLQLRIPYGGAVEDSDFTYYPALHYYPQPAPGQRVEVGWPLTFSFLSWIPYRALGLRGIYIVPVACGVLTAVLAGVIVLRLFPAGSPWVVLAVGVGSPVAFYAMLFWEHTLITCLGLLGLWFVARSFEKNRGPAWLNFLVGLSCVVIAVLIRLETALYALALLGATASAWCVRVSSGGGHDRLTSRRRRFRFVMILVFAAACLTLILLGERFVFPSYLHLPGRLLQQLRRWAAWREVPRHCVRVLVNDPTRSEPEIPLAWVSWGIAACLVCVLALFCPRKWRPFGFLPGAALATAVSTGTLLLSTRYRAVHSLLLPAPYLVFALATLPAILGNRVRPVELLIVMTPFLYLLLYTLVSHFSGMATGEAEWGIRYALLLYPLFSIPAAWGLRLLWSYTPARILRVALLCAAAACLAAGIGFSWRGYGELRTTKRDLAAFEREIRGMNVAVVTDLWWLPAALAPTFADHPMYFLQTRSGFGAWASEIGFRHDRFAFVSYAPLQEHEIATSRHPLGVESWKNVYGMRFHVCRVQKGSSGPPSPPGRKDNR